MYFLVLCSVEGTASECCPFKLAKQVKIYFLFCVKKYILSIAFACVMWLLVA